MPVTVTTTSMATSDDVRLDADIYRPEGDGPFPALLMRQPYGRKIASTVVYAHPAWYTEQGYLVVIQDVRGTGTSAGDFQLLANEAKDGAETVAWVAGLPDCSGKVGMYGFSYQGTTQLLALAGGAPALAAIAPAMVGWSVRDDWAYEGGAFRLGQNLAWAIQMAVLQARRAGDAKGEAALMTAAQSLPLTGAIPTLPDGIIDLLDRYGHYRDWLSNPPGGKEDYWKAIAPKDLLGDAEITVPALHIGGWFDGMLEGTLGAYAAFCERATQEARQQLLIGPWGHLPWDRRVGSVDMGPEAGSPIDQVQIAWFDHWLKGEDQGLDDEAPVQLFDLGAKTWRAFGGLPDPEPEMLYLTSSGMAAVDQAAGELVMEAPEASVDRIVHDPWRPVPSHGGHLTVPAGPQDRATVDGRFDVLTYTTQPLGDDLFLAGPVALELWAEADTESFDVSAVLSEVYRDGRTLTLTQGHQRVAPGATLPLTVQMRGLCATVKAGRRLRLSVAAAAFPGVTVNNGDGSADLSARRIDQSVITLTVHAGGERHSALMLPVAEWDAEDG